jgi:hypothetical protein
LTTRSKLHSSSTVSGLHPTVGAFLSIRAESCNSESLSDGPPVPENGSKSKARTASLVRAFELRAPYLHERNSDAQHIL